MAARRFLAAAAALLLLHAVPGTALACPSCARGDAGYGPIIALGVMILLPFAIAAAVVPALRRPASDETIP